MSDIPLPSLWVKTKLSAITEIVGGGTPSRSNERYFDGDIPWVTPTDVTALDSLWIGETKENISLEGLRRSSANLLPAGAVLLTSRATIGKTAITLLEMCTNQGFANFICDETLLSNEYLAYWLSAVQSWLYQLARGTTFKELSRSTLAKVQIPLPPISEQRHIVDILRRADELRRLRREADARMAELSAALFWEMFLNDQNEDQQQETIKLEDRIVFITSGSRGWAKYYANSGGKFIRVQNVLEGELNFDDIAFVQPPNGPDKERSQVKPGDLLVTITGSVGRVAVAPDDIGETYVSQHVAIVRLDGSLNPHYVASFINHPLGGQLQIAQLNYGQTKPGLNLSQIQSLRIPLVSDQLLQTFESRIQEIREIKQSQIESTEFLNNLFRSTLTRAFTGELTATWHEQHVEQLQEEAAQRDKVLGLRPRDRKKDYVAELDTPAGRAAFEQEVQEALHSTAESLVEVVTPQVRLGDVLNIASLVNLNQLVAPVLDAYRETVNTSLLRSVELLTKETQKALAEGVNTMLQPLAQSALEAQQQQMVALAQTITQMAALITRRPDKEHPRYHTLQALSNEQYWVYLKALQSDGYFTAESLREEDGLSIEHVRRTLSLLDALGLVVCAQVPQDVSGQSLFYIRAYRTTASVDDHDDTLAELEKVFPESPA